MLKGKTALVGGASKGIGAATAQALAEAGARVILLARQEEELKKVAFQLAPTADHKVLSLDLSDPVSLREKVQALLSEVGSIEILVCNAGGPKSGPLLEASGEEFEMALRTHVLANQTLAQLLVPGMKQKSYGRIVNIISTSVKTPLHNLGVSNTIRAAVASWAKTLANELGAYGITVNNVLPGYTNTERLEQLKVAASERLKVPVEKVESDWIQSVPAKRFAQPSEIAAAVAFLASPQASYINGINLPVDGGRTACL